ncbi:hypothetical protein Acr_20g0003770 [Actinidia rufa]|uniref:DUF8003 domain-containing protein n=1 Tax=Actinidia rufa TaxID=165716 RepID=A0A7J0GCR3_9ERIC|nr:hypothetical protein Acr_20g0003770 [Actinidia rufa]
MGHDPMLVLSIKVLGVVVEKQIRTLPLLRDMSALKLGNVETRVVQRENGTVTGKACPKGLYGTFCEECPVGTYKNVTGSDDEAFVGNAQLMSFHIVLFILLLEVLETNRNEESQSHVHRMYFMGPNTFSEPWHLPHTPPEQVKEIVYEGEFNRFVDEINALATYQWWEGSLFSILCILAYPLAWSWLQWRRKIKLQRLREFVRSEYDHACLRSCRSRALYEGLKVAATSDLMLAYVDFFLGGDEKRTDLPPTLQRRFPVSLLFGGDGSYMAPFSLHSDNIITSLMGQSVPPTTWYRFVAGLNAQLRLVRRGRLKVMFRPVLRWLETHANPALRIHGARVDLAWFHATACGYCQYGLLVYAVEEEIEQTSVDRSGEAARTDQQPRSSSVFKENSADRHSEEAFLRQSQQSSENLLRLKKAYEIIDTTSLKMLKEKMDIFYPLSFITHNTKPVGHQDLVGLVISMLLLGDVSLVLLTLLQLYSVSLASCLSSFVCVTAWDFTSLPCWHQCSLQSWT